MESLWNDEQAAALQGDPLALRVYTSRLLGQEPDLVLHGGGNTSVKATATNIFGDVEELLYVKGSGWDLATIEAPGFAPVRLTTLLRLAELPHLTDTEMVKYQRAAMTDPNAPNPSVEAILHALIPFKFVDHTHSDAVVTVTNSPEGESRIRKIFGDRVLIVPYVMPGFVLAKKIWEMTRQADWSQWEGMILLNHGVFTFDDEARQSYEKMISIVSRAEEYLRNQGATQALKKAVNWLADPLEIAKIRQAVSQATGRPVLARLDDGMMAAGFAGLPEVTDLATRGPVTPDHSIRTKRIPVILGEDPQAEVAAFVQAYREYFERNASEGQTCLDPGPRWGVWKGLGTFAFGRNPKAVRIITDITQHTAKCIQHASALSGWQALSEQEIFDVEYWELEQAKLRKGGAAPEFEGKIALVTGAASGIGKASVEALLNRGAMVTALDIDKRITDLFDPERVKGIVCDVTDERSLTGALNQTIKAFGGLDILVSNAGTFPKSATLKEMPANLWQKSLEVNLSSHQRLLKCCIPYLELGIDPAVILIASKNVPAPGPGAAAYSVAKAGLTQLARIAALELAEKGIRVNVIHPNAVYDTAIWTEEVLKSRAQHYGLTVAQYKTNNLLKTEVTSADVARLVCTMAGKVFGKMTGVQVPIDGGNLRVV